VVDNDEVFVSSKVELSSTWDRVTGTQISGILNNTKHTAHAGSALLGQAGILRAADV
jgi:hypothetical protein